MPEIFECNPNKTITYNLLKMKVLAKREKHMHPIVYTQFIINNQTHYKLYFNTMTHKYLLQKIESSDNINVIQFNNCSLDQLNLIIEILEEQFTDDGKWEKKYAKPLMIPETHQYSFNPLIYKPKTDLYFY